MEILFIMKNMFNGIKKNKKTYSYEYRFKIPYRGLFP